jgi:lipopolysaccharide export system protein LptA
MGKHRIIFFYIGMGLLGSACLIPVFAQTKTSTGQATVGQIKPSAVVAPKANIGIKKKPAPAPVKLRTPQNNAGAVAPPSNNPPNNLLGKDVPERPTSKDDPHVYYSAMYGQSEEKNKETIVTLQKNVKIYYQETIFETEKAVYNETKKIGSAPGKVKIQDKENIITGNKGEANYDTKVAVITGNVELKTQPKSERLKKDLEGPITLTCQKVDYYWGTKKAFPSGDIQIKLRAKKKDWVFTSDTAAYDGDKEIFVLKGNVHGIASDGSTVDGKEAYIYMKPDAEKSIVMTQFKGQTPREEEKKDPPKAETPEIDTNAPPPPTIEETTPPPK